MKHLIKLSASKQDIMTSTKLCVFLINILFFFLNLDFSGKTIFTETKYKVSEEMIEGVALCPHI